MRRSILIIVFLLCLATNHALAKEIIVEPKWPVQESISKLLEIARAEIGYHEGSHGFTKYGEWAGDPYAQWCAEFLCWCVNQTDEQFGTELLNVQYPLYSASNTGRNWFIRQGRSVVRNGHLQDWGYQWLNGTDVFLAPGDYVPQPGDWVFFTWTSNTDTDHVAMVEYCSKNESTGEITIHVIEGNTPDSVKRATYNLTYNRILGFGTVNDVCRYTMRTGNHGEKVRTLQTQLIKIGLLAEEDLDGQFGTKTAEAVREFQSAHGLRSTGIANMETQQLLDRVYEHVVDQEPETWMVTDTDSKTFDLDRLLILPDVQEEEEVEDIF